MIKLSISENANQNYLAKVTKVSKTTPIEGADFIHCLEIDYKTIVAGVDVKEGDIVIYFPAECQLSDNFLKEHNLYKDALLNNNPDAKPGMFDTKRRVKCIRLKGVTSEGFAMPISYFDVDNIEELVGTRFDSINDEIVIKKYVAKQTAGTPGSGSKKDKKLGDIAIDYLVEDQFKFHVNTEQLTNGIDQLKLNDYIYISNKVHGSSGISSRVLIKKKLNWKEKLANWICGNVNKEEYGYIYSSGKPKSKLPKGIIGTSFPKRETFYESGDAIWEKTLENLKPYLTKGLTVYYEIIGFTPTGQYIQKDYDYECFAPTNTGYKLGENYRIQVYRITYTDPDGETLEYTPDQVKWWCTKNGFESVEQYYEGTIEDFLHQHCAIVSSDDRDWKPLFLQTLKDQYLEVNCDICLNSVPKEGVVIRVNHPTIRVFKFKSDLFKIRESKQNDKGIIDIESQESDV